MCIMFVLYMYKYVCMYIYIYMHVDDGKFGSMQELTIAELREREERENNVYYASETITAQDRHHR
jgi:hypothetical protein